jgi:hypothetical protein
VSSAQAYSRDVTERVAFLIDAIGAALGGRTAMVVIQLPDRSMGFVPCPGFEEVVMEYMRGIDWDDAVRLAKSIE